MRIALCFAALNTNAQATYDWALNFGGTVNIGSQADDARTVKTDNSGNVFIGGTFYGSTDFDPGPGNQIRTSAGSGDGYIAKYDANGNFLAVYTFTNNLDCRLIALEIDNLGNIIATGHFVGSVDFDPGAGTYNLSSPVGYDFFVLKLNASGTLAWAVDIGSTSDDFGIDISADANNNVLVTGYFQGTTDFDPGSGLVNLSATTGGDAFVLKLSPVGVYSWAFNIGNSPNSNDRGTSIHTDALNNVFVGGNFQGICDFDPSASTTTLSATGTQSGFLVKFTSGGSFTYAKKFDGSGKSTVNDFNVNASNEIYVACTFSGTIDADPGAGVAAVSTGTVVWTDCLIVKLDALGNFIWVNQVGGIFDDGVDCIVSEGNDIYFSGFFFGNVDFDSGAGTNTITANGVRDYFVSKIDMNGNHLYTYSGGDAFGDDRAFAITTPSLNTIYLAGTFFGTTDFNPSAYATNSLVSNGGNDAFLLKLKNCTQTPTISSSSPTICAGTNASLTAVGSNTLLWNASSTSSLIVVSPTISTNYSVTATFTTGCVGTSTLALQVIVCTDLNEEEDLQTFMIVFPNPNNGEFTLNTEHHGIYCIRNTLGNVEYIIEVKNQSTTINITNLKPGIYFINYKNLNKKIIIH